MLKLILTWGMVILYVVFNASGALLIKHKMLKMKPMSFDHSHSVFQYFFQLLTSVEGIVGLTFIFGSAFAWMIALSKMELSLAYPIAVGLNFLLVLVFSYLLHGEILTTKQAVGVALILAGIFFMG